MRVADKLTGDKVADEKEIRYQQKLDRRRKLLHIEYAQLARFEFSGPQLKELREIYALITVQSVEVSQILQGGGESYQFSQLDDQVLSLDRRLAYCRKDVFNFFKGICNRVHKFCEENRGNKQFEHDIMELHELLEKTKVNPLASQSDKRILTNFQERLGKGMEALYGGYKNFHVLQIIGDVRAKIRNALDRRAKGFEMFLEERQKNDLSGSPMSLLSLSIAQSAFAKATDIDGLLKAYKNQLTKEVEKMLAILALANDSSFRAEISKVMGRLTLSEEEQKASFSRVLGKTEGEIANALAFADGADLSLLPPKYQDKYLQQAKEYNSSQRLAAYSGPEFFTAKKSLEKSGIRLESKRDYTISDEDKTIVEAVGVLLADNNLPQMMADYKCYDKRIGVYKFMLKEEKRIEEKSLQALAENGDGKESKDEIDAQRIRIKEAAFERCMEINKQIDAEQVRLAAVLEPLQQVGRNIAIVVEKLASNDIKRSLGDVISQSYLSRLILLTMVTPELLKARGFGSEHCNGGVMDKEGKKRKASVNLSMGGY